jgi:nucleoside-diphosphate-sugar epimerase
MRIAVTGATGFIGRALCQRLSDEGRALRALVRAPAPELAALPNCEQLAVGDLESFRDWQRALDGAQAIVHLAGYAHGRGGDEALQAVNVDATCAAAEAARAVGAHFVFVSSIKVHGEQSAAPLREDSPIAPGERYARSKARAEQALRSVSGLRLTVLRPPLVYGAGVKANFLALMRAIARGLPLPLASIDNRRSLVYVGNLVDAVVRCLGDARSAGRTYLVADDEAPSTPALCRALGVALARPARLLPFPPGWLPLKQLTRSLQADASAIRRELGWRAPFSLEEGLRATAHWYRSR